MAILAPRISTLLSLAPMKMPRSLPPWAVADEDTGCEILAWNGCDITIAPRLGGERAGQEILHLHYMARRLLLETSPPMPLLPDFRCRVCGRKLLRKAPPPWHEDGEWYWSRCDGCGDDDPRGRGTTSTRCAGSPTRSAPGKVTRSRTVPRVARAACAAPEINHALFARDDRAPEQVAPGFCVPGGD